MNTYTTYVTGYCVKCKKWVDIAHLALLRRSAHVDGHVCMDCLASRPWGYLKRHVIAGDYYKVANYKQRTAMSGGIHE